MSKFTPEQWDGFCHRLNEGGCPVLRDDAYKMSPVGLSIKEMPVMSFSEIFDLPDGGAGYAFEAVVRNDAIRPIDIQGFQIKLPWGTPKVSLVPAPKKSSTKYPNYSFPGVSRYYDGDFVLNPIFARRKYRLNPGGEIEGVLVGSSEESIPLEVPHDALIIARIRVFDSRGNTFSGRFRVRVNRAELIARERSKINVKREATAVHVRSNLPPQNDGMKDARWREAIPRGILIPVSAEHSPAPCTKSKYAVLRPAGKKRLSRKRGTLGDFIRLCAESAALSGSNRRKRARPSRGG